MHMLCYGFFPSDEGYEKIVFLYQLEQGQARKSYGLNVAALAGLDSAILRVASEKSRELETQCSQRRTLAKSRQQQREEAVAHRQRKEETVRTITSLIQQQDSCVDVEAVIHLAKEVS